VELSVAVAQVVALAVCELQSVEDTEALAEGLALAVGQAVRVGVRDAAGLGVTLKVTDTVVVVLTEEQPLLEGDAVAHPEPDTDSVTDSDAASVQLGASTSQTAPASSKTPSRRRDVCQCAFATGSAASVLSSTSSTSSEKSPQWPMRAGISSTSEPPSSQRTLVGTPLVSPMMTVHTGKVLTVPRTSAPKVPPGAANTDSPPLLYGPTEALAYALHGLLPALGTAQRIMTEAAAGLPRGWAPRSRTQTLRPLGGPR
jgi:hypothetical protein